MHTRRLIKRLATRLGVGLGVLLVIALAAAVVALSNATLEMTAGGAHTRLLAPVGGRAVSFPMYAGTGENVSIPGYLAGPVVRRHADGNWSAQWFCENQLQRADGGGDTLTLSCAGQRHDYALGEVSTPSAVAAMPDRLVVLSDLEGNLGFFETALRKLAIVDDAGHWQFGHGQLVILGDSVDRGREVFALLWRLRELSAQAQSAGGAVQVVLGNHEQYLLRGNASRAHPEYRHALRQLGGYEAAFAADTVLGSWLRAQPVALKLGSVVFVHGGVSPQVAQSGLSVAQLNEALRGYWPQANQQLSHTPALDAVLGPTGVTQYRGYFRGEDGGDAPAVTQQDVQRILAQLDATLVVVGHTLVDRVKPLFGGLVYAVDVNDDEAAPEVLAYTRGVAQVVNLGISRNPDTQPLTRSRAFSLLRAADRALLGAQVGAYRHMAAMPWPY